MAPFRVRKIDLHKRSNFEQNFDIAKQIAYFTYCIVSQQYAQQIDLEATIMTGITGLAASCETNDQPDRVCASYYV